MDSIEVKSIKDAIQDSVKEDFCGPSSAVFGMCSSERYYDKLIVRGGIWDKMKKFVVHLASKLGIKTYRLAWQTNASFDSDNVSYSNLTFCSISLRFFLLQKHVFA